MTLTRDAHCIQGCLRHMQNRHCPVWYYKGPMLSDVAMNLLGCLAEEGEPDTLITCLPASCG